MAFCGGGRKSLGDDVLCSKSGAARAAKVQQTDHAPLSGGKTGFDSAAFQETDVERNRVMGVLSYLFFLVLIPAAAAKDSPFARHHSNQGLVLFISEVCWCAAYPLLHSLLPDGQALVLLQCVSDVLVSLFLALSAMGVVNALGGKMRSLPLLGRAHLL